MCRSLAFLVVLSCIIFCVASPARRKFVSYDTETSSDPSVVVTNDGESWDDSDDDFDLEGDGWMKEVSASPPSPLPYDYEDYDAEEDSESEQPGDSAKQQDSEFLFLSPKETRLVLEDDDDAQSGLIKVRHSSKNTFPEPQEEDSRNFIEDSGDSNGQFVFTIDEDEDNNNNKIESSDDKDDDADFALKDSSESKTEDKASVPQRNDDDDSDDDDVNDDDDDDDDNQIESDNDSMFESPEEEAQVIYGDHVFLY